MRSYLSTGPCALLRYVAILFTAVAASVSAQTPQKCDVNGDRVIDNTDISAILAALNKPASGPADPRDADNNGVINILDARTCQTRCTRAACSTVNLPPTANAGADQSLLVGAVAHLSGSLSTDVDGPNPLTYTWSFNSRPAGSAAVLSGATTVTPSFTVDVAGAYRVRLVVFDGLASSAADEVVITTGNTPPVANAGPDQSVFVGNLVTLNGAGSTDVDGNALTYLWTLVKPAGSSAVLSGATTAHPTFTVDKPGPYSATLVVNDGIANSLPDTVVITTGNTAPVANIRASCTAVTNTDCAVTIGTSVGLDGSASTDVDGNALTYAWSFTARAPGSAASIIGASTVNASFVADAPGDFVVQLVVNDGTVNSVARTVRVTTNNSRPTALPTISPLSIPGVPTTMQLDGSGSTDPEHQALTYLWSLTAKPAGSTAALSSTTAVAPTFIADKLGTYTAQLIVNDGFLSSLPATATASSTNQAPTANAGPDQAVSAGAVVQLSSAGSSDPEGQPLGYFWSLLLKPAGSNADFVPGANAANPTLAADKKGTYVVQLIVNDGVRDSAPDTMQIVAGNRAPVANGDAFATPEDTALVVSAGGGVLANDSDADGDALTASIVGSTPAGLAFNANGGFTYTPAANANGPVTFQYRANDGSSDSNTVTVTINVTPVNDAPTANAGPNQGVAQGALVQLTGAGSSDPEGQPLTYAWTLTAKPTGSTGVLANPTSVTPTFTADLAGTYTARLIVNDGSLPSAPAFVTITAATGLPTVTVAATTPAASETGPVNGVITFTRTGPTTAALTVFYQIAGTAQNASDYNAIASSVVIPAGQPSATVTITPKADPTIEPDETVVLTIQPNASYIVGAAASATVTIADGIPNTVTIAATTPNASETGPVDGVFTFTRTGPTTFPLTVFFQIGGTAGNAIDYNSIASSVTIPAGQASATVTITPKSDAAVEPTESVILTIQANPATYLVGAPSSATVNIADDVTNTVSVVATSPNASETGPVNGVFTFTRSGPTTFSLTVFFQIGGTAGNAIDYNSIASSVTIPAGQASATVTITPRPDAAIEPTETVILTIQPNGSTYVVGAPSAATVSIADGVANTVSVVATTPNASETGPVDGVFTFTRSGPTTFALTVFFQIGGTAGNAIDYNSIPSSVTFPAGQASATVTITPKADAAIEPTETVILTIQPNASTYVVGAPSSATVNIADGVPNTVAIAATTPNASETGPVDGTFTVTRSGPTTFALTVFFQIGGTAANGIDYNSIPSSVTIPAGQASAPVVITPKADATIEPAETVILTLQPSASTYVVGAPVSATVTIADAVSDTVSVVATTPDASETGPVNGVFTFTRTGPTTFALTVFFQITGTAGNGVDYNTIASSVSIPANQASATVTIVPKPDAIVEPLETVTLTIQPQPANYVVGAPSAATVTISDVAGTVVSISASTPNASEVGPSNGVFTFARSGGDLTVPLNVIYTVGGTATNGADYQGIPTVFAIPANQTSGTLTIQPLKDNLVEGAETVVLTIQSDPSYAVGNSAATVTIADSPPIVTLVATTPNASEVGPVNGVFTFGRSGGDLSSALNVLYSVGGTATNGGDYVGIPTVFTIPANQASATLTIQVIQDNLTEGAETVVLAVQPDPSYSGTPTATVTIADSAAVVTLTATTANANEAGPVNGVFRFSRSGGDLTTALNVVYAVGGTATNGGDYQGIPTVFTIPANQASANLTIQVLKDNVVEGAESVILTLQPDPSYTFGTPSATVTIADSPAVVTLTASVASASEVGPVNGTFTFARSGGDIASALNVIYNVGGTATNGGDYQGIPTVFTIPANQASANLTIQVIKDNLVEGPETVVLTVQPDPSYSGTPTATVTIADSPAIVTIAATTPTANEVGPVAGVFTFTRSGGDIAAALNVDYTIGGTATNGGDYQGIPNVFTIPAGQLSGTLSIVPVTDGVAEGTETVVLTLAASPTYTIGASGTATVSILEGAGADIAVTNTVSNATPTIGQTIIFSIKAKNNGPGATTSTTIRALLPAGYTFAGINAGSYDSTTGDWTVGALSVGQTAQLDLYGVVLATGPYNLTASRIAGAPADGVPGNDSAIANVTPFTTADIAVANIVSNATPTVGQTIVFSIKATNNGPGVTTSTTIRAPLPAGYTFAGISGGSYDSTTGDWSLGALNVGQTVQLDVYGTVLASGPYNVTATRLSGVPADNVAGNNSATATVTPSSSADIAVTNVVSNSTPSVGQTIIFSVRATNNGPGVTTITTIRAPLPAGYTFAGISGGSYDPTTGDWTIGPLNVAQTAQLDIFATVLPTGSYNVTATRFAGVPSDGVAGNNTATATVTPFATADIAVANTVDNATPTVGQTIVFTLKATNNGPGVTTITTIRAPLPAGYGFAGISGGSYDSTTGDWTVGPLNVGQVAQISLFATVLATGPYNVTATRFAGVPSDGVAGNNTATATVTPFATADIAVGNTVDIANPAVGQTIVFTIKATNNGPGTTTSTTIRAPLPAGYTFLGTSGGSYDSTTGDWTIGLLNVAQVAQTMLFASVLPTGPYNVTATRFAGVPADGVAGNNSATAIVTPH